MEPLDVVPLGPEDIDRILDLERSAFAPAMQASRETVLERFALGHSMLGAEKQGRLIGAVAFSYMRFNPENLDDFPRTFKVYSRQPTPTDFNTLAIYSLGIEPGSRGLACARLLIHAAYERAQHDGCTRTVADGPIPSLAGNEQIRPKPEVRALIERYVQSGQLPTQEEFLQDPLLGLYHLLTGCRFLRLLPDFLPEDEASEGWRVLLYREL